MKCRHVKEQGLLWCTPCGEIKAGLKPECEWKHGDYAISKRWDDDNTLIKVIDSEIHLAGLATDSPKWWEYLTLKYSNGTVGGGTASLFEKFVRENKGD